MRGAGDARVVVPDRLLALAGELGVVEIQPRLDERAQVGLDGRLVLRRRGDDAGAGDDPVLADLVPVVQGASGRLRDPAADRGTRVHLDGRAGGRLVGVDDPKCLVDRVDDLHGAHDDAAERVVAGRTEPGGLRRLARQRRQPA